MRKDYEELFDYLGENFQHIDERFQGIDQKFQHIDEKFEGIDRKFDRADQRFTELDNKISQLPTKSYLDDKMADLEGGFVSKLRTEDQKVNRLTQILKEKEMLGEGEASELKGFKVFPR